MELQERILSLQQELSSPRQIAFCRIKFLEEDEDGQNQAGLAFTLVPLLKDALNAWLALPKKKTGESETTLMLLAERLETINLQRVLMLHLHVTKMDPSLGEELGRQGSHGHLVKLMNLDLAEYIDDDNNDDEADQDTVIELQDLACEIAALGCSFPVKYAPFCPTDLRQRLPLVFHVGAVPVPVSDSKTDGDGLYENKSETETVLIHQVTTRQTAQEDVGFVMWPSAVVLSQWLVTNPSVVRGNRVLELGAGCGLTGLVAARLQKLDADTSKAPPEYCEQQQQEVILSDFNTVVLQNLQRNVALNNVTEVCRVMGLDFYQQSGTAESWKDMNGVEQEQVDVVLAADMICQPADAVGAANTIHDALRPGGRAIVVCADAAHRFGVDHFQSECQRVGLEITAENVGDMYEEKLLASGLEQTAGYVQGMSLTMFFLEKSVSAIVPGV